MAEPPIIKKDNKIRNQNIDRDSDTRRGYRATLEYYYIVYIMY